MLITALLRLLEGFRLSGELLLELCCTLLSCRFLFGNSIKTFLQARQFILKGNNPPNRNMGARIIFT